MKDVAPHDRPREKLERLGAAGLGDNELLALVLGSGSRGAERAGRWPTSCSSMSAALHGLTRMAIGDLRRVAGVGRARAAQVLAAVELGRRTLMRGGVERPQLNTPRQLAAYLLPLYGAAAVEQFGIVMLDTKHRVIRIRIVVDRLARLDGRASARSVSRGDGRGAPRPSCCSTTTRPAIRRRAPTTWC